MSSLTHAALDAGVVTARKKVRRHRQLVLTLRVLFAVVMLGSWELLSRTKTIDPFFFGRPSDIAGLVAFLSGADSEFMTGSYLLMDGGLRDARGSASEGRAA